MITWTKIRFFLKKKVVQNYIQDKTNFMHTARQIVGIRSKWSCFVKTIQDTYVYAKNMGM
jgi:hypothetical protein